MRVDDYVDFFQLYIDSSKVLQKFFFREVKTFCPFRQLVADTRFNQDGLLAGLHDDRIAADRDAVHIVGFYLALPHHFRNYAKKPAAIAQIVAVRDGGELKITERNGLVLQCTIPSPRVRDGSATGCV